MATPGRIIAHHHYTTSSHAQYLLLHTGEDSQKPAPLIYTHTLHLNVLFFLYLDHLFRTGAGYIDQINSLPLRFGVVCSQHGGVNSEGSGSVQTKAREKLGDES